MPRERIKRAESRKLDPIDAVAELQVSLSEEDLDALIFFYSSRYDADVLSRELNSAFPCTLIGCSTAGEIGSEILSNGIVAAGLPKSHFKTTRIDFPNLSDLNVESFEALSNAAISHHGRNVFAFSLIDGMSVQEERFLAHLDPLLGSIPLVGGSAGDDLAFERTTVFCNSEATSNAASVSLIETDLIFEPFQLQHFTPTPSDLVITAADPARRIVHEIDGGVAAEEYAALLGLRVDELNPEVFSNHPVMLQIGDSWYVRSIQKVLPDGSLVFYCAIEEGLPLTLAESTNLVENLRAKTEELLEKFTAVELSLGCDCILRRLEIEAKKLQGSVSELLSSLNLVGFHTYGEHFNSVHINQTLTGVVLGYAE